MTFSNENHGTVTVNASAAALAWVNAFHATSQDDGRPALYRCLSVEIYFTGVQFIATNGSILLRTWVPRIREEKDAYPWPDEIELPECSVVVMDRNHFALSFMKALASAAKDFEVAEVSFTVEPAPLDEIGAEPPLGAEFSKDTLTLRAFGQQHRCQLLEDKYANWRQLDFGIDKSERVDGMKLSTDMFSTIGKLKGVLGIDCTFTGDGRQIILNGIADSIRGVMMPMSRRKKMESHVTTFDPKQLDAMHNAQVKLNGEWVPATLENCKAAFEMAHMSGQKLELREQL